MIAAPSDTSRAIVMVPCCLSDDRRSMVVGGGINVLGSVGLQKSKSIHNKSSPMSWSLLIDVQHSTAPAQI